MSKRGDPKKNRKERESMPYTSEMGSKEDRLRHALGKKKGKKMPMKGGY